MTISERLLNGLDMFSEDQDEIVFSFEDMAEGFKFGMTICFESTDDYWSQVVEFENGLLSDPVGEPKFSRAQFKEIVSDGLDVFAFTRSYEGHEETLKEILNSL